MTDYQDFLASKHVRAVQSGFEPGELPAALFPFQRDVVAWACRQGRAGVWAQTGLGKTLMQLSWAEQVHRHTGSNVLVLCPLAVAKQTAREAVKFGIETPVKVCRGMHDVIAGINVANYQMLKHFEPGKFSGVVIDESDILADFSSVTRFAIRDAFASTQYKLDCSATPAPNHFIEIGSHADFLGVMEVGDMLTRWFITDQSEARKIDLKVHGQDDFWRWISTWACAVNKPSDLGYEDGAYDLPPLHVIEHEVDIDIVEGREDGMLFRAPAMSATGMHRELRRTTTARVAKVLEIVESIDSGLPIVLWCHTDYEADELRKQIPGAVEVRGSHPVEKKERNLEDFALGKIRVLVSKPSICGHGLNWQHCHNMIFVGLDYSFKGFYQAIRRLLRFGQTMPVNVHVILAATEGRLLEVIQRKQADYDEMQSRMGASIRRFGLGAERAHLGLSKYAPSTTMNLPTWLQGVA